VAVVMVETKQKQKNTREHTARYCQWAYIQAIGRVSWSPMGLDVWNEAGDKSDTTPL